MSKLGQWVQAAKVKSADDMSEELRKKRSKLIALDSFWGICDQVILLLVGQGAESRAAATIMGKLPAKDRRVEISVAKHSLEQMANAKAFTMSPAAVQAGLKHVSQHLEVLSQGLPVSVELDKISRLARDCLGTFKYFLVVEDTKSKVLVGDDAFEYLLKTCIEAKEKGAEMPSESAKLIMQYQWMALASQTADVATVLEAAQKSEVQATKKMRTGAKGSASSSTTGASSSSSGGAAASRKLEKEHARREAMKYVG